MSIDRVNFKTVAVKEGCLDQRKHDDGRSQHILFGLLQIVQLFIDEATDFNSVVQKWYFDIFERTLLVPHSIDACVAQRCMDIPRAAHCLLNATI